ncbi:MAG TPA: hypothetical protein DEQ40_08165 [Oxalobacteraceae bacterium]|nr:hypothetical protein [Oxalobacteraceae bacterium]
MNTDTVAASLSKSAGQASRAARAEAEIVKAAHARRDIVESKLAELKPKTLLDRAAAEQYEDYIAERAHLDQVIGRARHA